MMHTNCRLWTMKCLHTSLAGLPCSCDDVRKRVMGSKECIFRSACCADQRRSVPAKRINSRSQKEFAVDGQIYRRCNAGSSVLDSTLVMARQACANGVIMVKWNMVVIGILTIISKQFLCIFFDWSKLIEGGAPEAVAAYLMISL